MKSAMFSQRFSFACLAVRPPMVSLALLTSIMLVAGNGRAASPGALDLSFGLRGTAALTMGSFFQEARPRPPQAWCIPLRWQQISRCLWTREIGSRSKATATIGL